MVIPTLSLGDTGAQVSALCLGTLNFGSRTDRDTSITLLDAYTEAGGSFLDTANCYSYWVPGCAGGESEALLGAWMRERGNRERIFIATKVFNEYPGAERGLGARQIEEECEKSLQRLQTDMIDLYYAHTDDREVPLEETLAAFDRLARAGKVRSLGASNFRAWRLERAREVSRQHGWAQYCCIQQRYSYLRPRPGAEFHPWTPPATDDLLDFCRNNPVPLIAYSPLMKGAYDRADREFPAEYTGADAVARLAALRAVAEEVGARPTQVVLAWMLQSTPPVIPLFSASTVEQLQSNLQAAEVRLTAEQMEQLNTAGA
jgi:aryl-alcohol dehydrogenase-like predicted oxidoreductase